MVSICLRRLWATLAILGWADGTGARGRGRPPASLIHTHAGEQQEQEQVRQHFLQSKAKMMMMSLGSSVNASAGASRSSSRLQMKFRSRWGDGPWKPAAQPSGSGRTPGNLCVDGHLLPELYLIGAPKSSTTSLALDLIFAGIWRVHDQYSDKEFHFFDGMMDWNVEDDTALEVQRQLWLKWLPACPSARSAGLSAGEDPPRRLLADFTPDYMRMVPMPQEFGIFGTYPPWKPEFGLHQLPEGGTTVINMPPVLKRLYGPQAYQRVSFITLLREPLARMQSAWYHAASTGFTNECVDCRAPSFKEALKVHLRRTQKKIVTDWVWTGLYGLHLQEWVVHFDPARFFVIPFGYLMHGDNKDAICRGLSKHVSFNIDCESNGRPMDHEWSHEHPKLNDDSYETARDRFQKFIEPYNQQLVKVLAEYSTKGMVLANYGGAAGDAPAVKEWLEKGW